MLGGTGGVMRRINTDGRAQRVRPATEEAAETISALKVAFRFVNLILYCYC